MTHALTAAAALMVLLGFLAPALSEETPAESEPSLEALICGPYGPGYKLITGTTTCVKVSGSVTVTVGGPISGGNKPKSGNGAR